MRFPWLWAFSFDKLAFWRPPWTQLLILFHSTNWETEWTRQVPRVHRDTQSPWQPLRSEGSSCRQSKGKAQKLVSGIATRSSFVFKLSSQAERLAFGVWNILRNCREKCVRFPTECQNLTTQRKIPYVCINILSNFKSRLRSCFFYLRPKT